MILRPDHTAEFSAQGEGGQQLGGAGGRAVVCPTCVPRKAPLPTAAVGERGPRWGRLWLGPAVCAAVLECYLSTPKADFSFLFFFLVLVLLW